MSTWSFFPDPNEQERLLSSDAAALYPVLRSSSDRMNILMGGILDLRANGQAEKALELLKMAVAENLKAAKAAIAEILAFLVVWDRVPMYDLQEFPEFCRQLPELNDLESVGVLVAMYIGLG